MMQHVSVGAVKLELLLCLLQRCGRVGCPFEVLCDVGSHEIYSGSLFVIF